MNFNFFLAIAQASYHRDNWLVVAKCSYNKDVAFLSSAIEAAANKSSCIVKTVS